MLSINPLLHSPVEPTEDFIRKFGKKFAGFPKGELTLHFKKVDKSLGLGGTGFRPEMNDGDGLPWRHAAAFVVAGYDLGETAARGAALAWEFPGSRGASVQDVRLGGSAAALGSALKNGYLTSAQVGQWIRDNF